MSSFETMIHEPITVCMDEPGADPARDTTSLHNRLYRTASPTQPSGFEVYRWPEFKALCDRLGVAYDLWTVDITIKLTLDEVLVTQSYRPKDDDHASVRDHGPQAEGGAHAQNWRRPLQRAGPG